MAVSFLTGLPYDIKELILSNITSTNDLASFAGTSKEWASLIIPYHIAYRDLRLSKRPDDLLESFPRTSQEWQSLVIPHQLRAQPPLRMQPLFAYLAQHVNLCKNIRSVYINERYTDPKTVTYLTPESFILKGIQDSSYAEGEDHSTGIGISHVLSSMDGLLKFTWDFPWRGYDITNSDAEKTSILNILSRSRTLRTLEFLDNEITQLADNYVRRSAVSLELHNNFASVDSPLWRISNLTSLNLSAPYWATWAENSNLTEMLKRSPNLEKLNINYQMYSPSFTPCHFPKLCELTLFAEQPEQSAHSIDECEARQAWAETKILTFLYKHPTIRYLNWYLFSYELEIPEPSSLNLKFLPNLKNFTSDSSDVFIKALIRHNITYSERTTPPTLSHPQFCTLKSISQIGLDPEMMRLLEYISGPELKELSLWRYDSLKMVERVGDLFPNIEVLHTLLSEKIGEKKYNLEELIQLLAHFPSLKYLLSSHIWYHFLWLDCPERDTMVSKLAQACPKLTHIQHIPDGDTVDAYIVLFREESDGNCKVRWEKRGYRERPKPIKV